MRKLCVSQVTEAVARLCVEANTFLNDDIRGALEASLAREQEELPRFVLETIVQNAELAPCEGLPICQDTGMAVIFLDIGQDLHFTGGLLYDAVQEGVRQGYVSLRKSVVGDPVERVNTKDNSPAVIHTELVVGDRLRIIAAPKGFGSENMGALGMLKPSDGAAGIMDFVTETVRKAGANPCPPVIVGVGVGGTMEKACLLAKRALLRPVGKRNPNPMWADMETELLTRINALGIGAGGFGGGATALGVHIELYPTHIAGLPVAVNLGCHVTRHREVLL